MRVVLTDKFLEHASPQRETPSRRTWNTPVLKRSPGSIEWSRLFGFRISDSMEPEVSIVMPCLNEARTLATCIKKAQLFLKEHGISGEVIVADNGSTDGSVEIAGNLNARIVRATVRGYGAALAAGINAAQGKYVIIGDSDQSYDFSALSPFVEKLRDGYDLVMGNRFRGGIAPDAMPPLHRYFGNPLLTAIGRLFFSCKQCGDFYCGLRGFRKDAVQEIRIAESRDGICLRNDRQGRDASSPHYGGSDNTLSRRSRPRPAPSSLPGRLAEPALLPFNESTMAFWNPGAHSAGGRAVSFDRNTSRSAFRRIDHL